ncbi:MAG: prepilin-type N-terminal cleavage/methylation domain-containing protein [Armatimonadota bacterium]|nr:prepilin-type N-terminal cleavage/methylation domain-containing protein [bacterium]
MCCSARKRGFTLIEMVIVVVVLAILLAMAIPNFLKSRENTRARSCIANLHQILSAKEQLTAEKKLKTGDSVAWSDLTPNYIKVQPKCPAGAVYNIQPIGTNPTCLAAGHELP